MKADFDTISSLDEVLEDLTFINDNLSALCDSCCNTSCEFPKTSLMLPTFALAKVINQCERIIEELKMGVMKNAG